MLVEYLKKHKFAGVILDTNLLMLYLIGSFDPKFVPVFKRTSMYSEFDYEWLNEYVTEFAHVVVTPQILAETWNFLEMINEKKFKEFIQVIIPTLYLFKELYVEKDIILDNDGFHYIGVTDISVILAAKSRGCLVITDDLRAYGHYLSNEVSVININHLRIN